MVTQKTAQLALQEIKIKQYAQGILDLVSQDSEKQKEMVAWARKIHDLPVEEESKIIVPPSILKG